MSAMHQQQQALAVDQDAGTENQQKKEDQKEADRPGVVAARSLLASGKATPEDFAALIKIHIFDRNEIFAFLHEHCGNAFVDQVMQVAMNGPIQTTEAVAEMERGGPGVEAVKALLLMDADPEAFKIALLHNSHDFDEMTALIREKKGPEFLALVVQPPKQDLSQFMLDGEEAAPTQGLVDDGTVQDAAPVDNATPTTGLVEDEGTVKEEQKKMVETAEPARVETTAPSTTTEPATVAETSATPEVAEAAKVIEGTAETKPEEKEEEPGWVTRARAYNEEHAAEVAAFNQLTNGSCSDKDGQLDPRAVSNWQAAHKIASDGRVGQKTVAAAQKEGAGGGEQEAAPAVTETPKKESGSLVRARELISQFNRFDALWQPFVIKDADLLKVLDVIVDLIRLWHALVDEAGVVLDQLDREGHRGTEEREALCTGLPPIPDEIEICSDRVAKARCGWGSLANAYDNLWAAYMMQRASAPTA